MSILNPDDTENRFILYPNLATNYIQISGINTKATLSIYSMDERKVFEANNINQQSIALPDVPSGLYLVIVEEENRRNTFKLIIFQQQTGSSGIAIYGIV